MSFLIIFMCRTFAISNSKDMQITISNEQLTALLPNIAVTVKGETPLIDKLAPFLDAAESRVSDTFFLPTIFADIGSRNESDTLRSATTLVIVYEAFRRALPHLDVVFTLNGFGIVSNANIAPASKERIERLLSSLLINRDAAISQLLTLLCKQNSWLATEQAEFFRATMFPILKQNQSLQDYLDKRVALIPIEEHIAEQYLSNELLFALRAQVQAFHFSTDKYKHICRVLQAVEVDFLSNFASTTISPWAHRTLTQIVELIRSNPEDFPEWHTSTTAQLYSRQVFENKKDAKDFWF